MTGGSALRGGRHRDQRATGHRDISHARAVARSLPLIHDVVSPRIRRRVGAWHCRTRFVGGFVRALRHDRKRDWRTLDFRTSDGRAAVGFGADARGHGGCHGGNSAGLSERARLCCFVLALTIAAFFAAFVTRAGLAAVNLPSGAVASLPTLPLSRRRGASAQPAAQAWWLATGPEKHFRGGGTRRHLPAAAVRHRVRHRRRQAPRRPAPADDADVSPRRRTR